MQLDNRKLSATASAIYDFLQSNKAEIIELNTRKQLEMSEESPLVQMYQLIIPIDPSENSSVNYIDSTIKAIA